MPHQSTYKALVKRGYSLLSLVFTVTIFMLSSFQPYIVSAADFASEKRKLDMGITFADDVTCAAAGAAAGAAVVAGAGGAGVDKTNINPKVTYEYGAGPRVKTGLPPGADITLEDWAKLVLKSLAAGYGGNAEEITSEEKVKVLVAMAIQEGGSRQNKAAYNMFNVAKDPKTQDDLNPIINNTYKDGNTHPAFKTLDEGVEAVVRFIEKGHYSRIHDLLTDPNTTAESFVAGIDNLSYNGATGQEDWAAGGYGPKLQNVLSQLEKNPERMKWTVLGDKDSPGRKALAAAGVAPADEVSPIGGPTPTASTGGDASSCACTENELAGDFSGGDNQETAYNFFVSKGLTPEQSSGIVGNLMQESTAHLLPDFKQGGVASDDGQIVKQGDGPGHGIAQWTDDGPGGDDRFEFLKKFAALQGGDHLDITIQLQFIWYEMTGEPPSEGIEKDSGGVKAYSAVRSASTIEDAVRAFCEKYERAGKPDYPSRIKYANEVFQKYGGGGAATPLVKKGGRGFFASLFSKLANRNKVEAQLNPTTGDIPPPAGTDASVGTDGEAAATSGGGTVLLDPGHGGAVPDYTDDITGLGDRETANSPETQDVWDVTQKVKTDLEAANFKVFLSRDSVNGASKKRDRVNKATENKVDVAVSIHHDAAQKFENFGEVWPQHVGGYRQSKDKKIKEVFDNEATASKSLEIANKIAEARTAAEGRPATVSADQSVSFGEGRGDLSSYGDMSLLQLYSKEIPWVYNEIGVAGDGGGDKPATPMSDDQKTKYAKGIADGIKGSIGANKDEGSPLTCAGTSGGGAGIVAGNIVQTALNLAWDHPVAVGVNSEAEAKPEYVAARNKYNPSGDHRWASDCGVFVSTVMKASGADPEFPGSGTGDIKTYLENSPKYQVLTSISSESELQPGDILSRVGHVYLYTGQPNAKAVEASLGDRVPATRKGVNPLPPGGGYIAARLVNREKL